MTQLRTERRRQDVQDMSAECSVTTPIDPTHKTRTVEREGRQRRRREARRDKSVINHRDGMSSDDELLEATVMKYKNDIGISLYYCTIYSFIVNSLSRILVQVNL